MHRRTAPNHKRAFTDTVPNHTILNQTIQGAGADTLYRFLRRSSGKHFRPGAKACSNRLQYSPFDTKLIRVRY